jgi:LacI family repressor for deo operon, udp, cdd, tsx, nupC, and nupG
MTTIIDVARHARVSTATVSRTLSRPSGVKDELRERVLASIDALGYVPNRAARSLRTQSASKILVTVPDISNPFFANIIRGAEEVARQAGFGVVLGDTRHETALENQYAQMLRRKEVDGLLFLGHRLPETLEGLISSNPGSAPVVNGCEYSSDLGVSSVHIDNAAAGADATEYLLSLGHTRIGIVTGPLVSPLSRDRLKGAMDVAHRHGISDGIHVATGDFSIQSGCEAAARLIAAEDVTAIFCFSDEMAMGAIEAVRRAGLSCPEDISVMGFDDIRFARFLTPALTTIAQPSEEIGREAMTLLLNIIAGEQIAQKSITLTHELIVRKSTARARA